MEDLDLHLTVLASWLVRTVGKAMMWSFGVATVLGIAAVVIGDSTLLGLAFLVGPLVFAFFLVSANAPIPSEASKSPEVSALPGE